MLHSLFLDIVLSFIENYRHAPMSDNHNTKVQSISNIMKLLNCKSDIRVEKKPMYVVSFNMYSHVYVWNRLFCTDRKQSVANIASAS